jgi:pyrimidine-specific ribonucleoside hydrolase
MTFQGGFLPYSLHLPAHPLPQFEGKEWVPTFNFNGDRKAVDALCQAPLARRNFCGKNVCHGIVLTKPDLGRMARPRHQAGEVYLKAATLYFEKHPEKKMHDPTALACHLHPEVATWFRGRPQRAGGGWTTMPDENGDYVLADVDRDRLWDCLLRRV